MDSELRPTHVLVAPSWTADAEKPYSGVFFREQALALRRAGLRVGFVCVEQRSLRHFAWQKLRTSYFQMSYGEQEGLQTVRMHAWNTLCQTTLGALVWTRLLHRAIETYIARYGMPDVIHAHSALWAGYAAWTFSQSRGVPYVITEHSTAFPLRRIEPHWAPYVRRALNGASAVIAVGQKLKRALSAYIAPERVSVIPNLLDASFFSAPARSWNRRAPGGPFTFLSLGNLIAVKGFDLLLQAFAQAFRGAAEVTLSIGGDGPERTRLVELAARLGIGAQVNFRGALSRAEVRAAMLAADAFVLASHVETFAVVVAEAMALGLPVIATRSGGPEDFVSPETGHLVDCGDAAALADRMSELRRTGGCSPQQIREQIRKYASPAVVTAHLERVYKVACA
jgi:glycosyltransferase involved in cell wall biosynthesis